MSHNRRNRGSRREEPAPDPEYDPHLLSPRYQNDQYSTQQTDPYATGQYYDAYNDQALEDGFLHLNVDDGQHPDDFYAYQQQEPAPSGQNPTYDPYAYPAGHSADPGSYSYPDAYGAYEQDTSTQPGTSEDAVQGFDALLEQAQAGAYSGNADLGHGYEGAAGSSSGQYGSPDAPPAGGGGEGPNREQGNGPGEGGDGSQEDTDMSLFRVEWSSAFSPGTIFKVMWSEPQGLTRRATGIPTRATDPTRATQEVEVAPGIYHGLRRFIVVNSADGNSSCVPIFTYERRGCTKRGVNPRTHGIVHGARHTPRLLRHEPRLGFASVAVDLINGERLTPESRVNYARLQTIEHNLEVRIIGRVTDEDFPIVLNAVDRCWRSRTYPPSRRNRNSR